MDIDHKSRSSTQEYEYAVSEFMGRTGIVATKHGKEQALHAPLLEHVGLSVTAPKDLDTDQLGTFSGEIPRKSSMEATVLAKARWGMQVTGSSIGLATEGSFQANPIVPFANQHTEAITFIDRKLNIEIIEWITADQIVCGKKTVGVGDDFGKFLEEVEFPSHALIVKPNKISALRRWFNHYPMAKGIKDHTQLRQAIKKAAGVSSDQKVVLESDMRACMNPTRMETIGRLGERLANRLLTPCPNCDTPGWGRTQSIPGLPCGWCGLPTKLIQKEIYYCSACEHVEQKPRTDGKVTSDPRYCDYCNP